MPNNISYSRINCGLIRGENDSQVKKQQIIKLKVLKKQLLLM